MLIFLMGVIVRFDENSIYSRSVPWQGQCHGKVSAMIGNNVCH